MEKDIQSIISPKSIAVVGATNRPGSVGRTVFSNIINGRYKGVLYPVNPGVKSVNSIKAYPSLTDIPDEVDLAVIIVPPKFVVEIMEEAGRKKVKGAVVITAGFKETGEQGADLEAQLKDVARNHGICMVGPNCLGVVNTNEAIRLNASFATKGPKSGNIAFISQSGALCTAVLDYADGRNIGFSKFVSFGNKADVNEIDLLRYLKDDPDTDVILMYLEDITNGREFLDMATEITWGTPKTIFAIKSGRSAEGARAAASHTGSLAGSDSTYEAIFCQSGIQRVEDINELFDYAVAYARQPLPKGGRIAIVTNAGGPGIMATDAAIRHGLELASFSDETLAQLKENLPPTASILNPVDVIGDATHERYEVALRHILSDENVDGAIVILSPQAMIDVLETAAIVPRVAEGIDKPVLCSFMGIVDVSEGVQFLESHGLPNYTFPEAAVRAMASMVNFSSLLKIEKREFREVAAECEIADQIIRAKLSIADRYFMTEREANKILGCYGFPVLKTCLVQDISQVEQAVTEVGLPVAMKISSPDIIHKFDAGGVLLKIKSVEQAQEAFQKINKNAKAFNSSARIEGVLVEQMAKGGVEVILGAARDPKFGPICMFGLGGTFVEAMQDVTFRMVPMTEASAGVMIRTIKAYRVLKGIRGAGSSDIDAIKDCLLRLSQMVSEHPEIIELDINPLIVYPAGEGCVVADSRILLSKL